MGAKILIVEDNADDRLIQARQLSGSGFEVDLVENWTDACHKLPPNQYDAVLLDIGLPDAHMNEVVRLAKSTFPKAAIVVLSGNDDPAYIKHCIQQTASNYLVKGKDDTNAASFTHSIRTAINEMKARLLLTDMQRAI